MCGYIVAFPPFLPYCTCVSNGDFRLARIAFVSLLQSRDDTQRTPRGLSRRDRVLKSQPRETGYPSPLGDVYFSTRREDDTLSTQIHPLELLRRRL